MPLLLPCACSVTLISSFEKLGGLPSQSNIHISWKSHGICLKCSDTNSIAFKCSIAFKYSNNELCHSHLLNSTVILHTLSNILHSSSKSEASKVLSLLGGHPFGSSRQLPRVTATEGLQTQEPLPQLLLSCSIREAPLPSVEGCLLDICCSPPLRGWCWGKGAAGGQSECALSTRGEEDGWHLSASAWYGGRQRGCTQVLTPSQGQGKQVANPSLHPVGTGGGKDRGP